MRASTFDIKRKWGIITQEKIQNEAEELVREHKVYGFECRDGFIKLYISIEEDTES